MRSDGADHAPRFELRREGGRIEAIAAGIDRRTLRRLRRGELELEWELDLHGLSEAEARRAVEGAVQDAVAEGVRGLLVIHGRGRHSDLAGPVLRDAVPDWLVEAPSAAWVMAFATARPEDGGEGSLAVWLRRRR